MAKISRTRVTSADTSNMDMPHDVEREAYSDLSSHEQDEMDANPYAAPEMKRGGVTRSPVGSGWGEKPQERRETVKAPILKLKDAGTRVVKLLDPVPPVKYKRHYVNSKGKYYTCIKTADTACPLCTAGVRPSWTFVMNVVDMADDPTEVKTWTFGTEVSSQLQDFAENKELDLNAENVYFEVRHVKVAGRSAPSTKVDFLRARDLMEDHSLEPLNEDEILELEEDRFGAEVVYINTLDYLEDVALDVVPGDLPQKRSR